MSPRHPIALSPACIPAMLRDVDHLRARGEHALAAELEGLLETPITVRGREYVRVADDSLTWWQWHGDREDVSLFAYRTGWHALITVEGVNCGARVQCSGPTPEAAIDAASRVALDTVTARLTALLGGLS